MQSLPLSFHDPKNDLSRDCHENAPAAFLYYAEEQQGEALCQMELNSERAAYALPHYTNDEGLLVNDTCHEEWDKILDRMIFLWRETDEETCSKKNPYEEEYMKAFEEFTDEYGVLGEKLQTPEELEANRKRGGGGTVHFMREIPEYTEIAEKHREEDLKLEQYRNECKDEVMNLMREHFFALWD